MDPQDIVIQAIEKVAHEGGFGEVRLVIKDGRITHVVTSISQQVNKSAGGDADPTRRSDRKRINDKG